MDPKKIREAIEKAGHYAVTVYLSNGHCHGITDPHSAVLSMDKQTLHLTLQNSTVVIAVDQIVSMVSHRMPQASGIAELINSIPDSLTKPEYPNSGLPWLPMVQDVDRLLGLSDELLENWEATAKLKPNEVDVELRERQAEWAVLRPLLVNLPKYLHVLNRFRRCDTDTLLELQGIAGVYITEAQELLRKWPESPTES